MDVFGFVFVSDDIFAMMTCLSTLLSGPCTHAIYISFNRINQYTTNVHAWYLNNANLWKHDMNSILLDAVLSVSDR